MLKLGYCYLSSRSLLFCQGASLVQLAPNCSPPGSINFFSHCQVRIAGNTPAMRCFREVISPRAPSNGGNIDRRSVRQHSTLAHAYDNAGNELIKQRLICRISAGESKLAHTCISTVKVSMTCWLTSRITGRRPTDEYMLERQHY